MADLNGDGRDDLLSGSWPGEIYLFTRSDDGEWNDAVVLNHTSGEPVKVGSATAVAPIDWDDDGDLDLIVGEIQGRVFLVLNEGTTTEPAFGDVQPLLAAGEPINLQTDSGPTVADWNADGTLDLLCGDGNGGVTWFQGTRADGEMTLGAAQTLIEPISMDVRMAAYENPQADPDGALLTRSDSRSKIAVADWNNDGHPDLLVGDFASTFGEEPVLTDDQIAERDRLQAEIDALQPKQMAMYEDVDRMVREKLGVEDFSNLTEEQSARIGTLWQEVMSENDEWEAMNERSAELYAAMQPFERPRMTHGWVWVYLRSVPAVAQKPMSLKEAAGLVTVGMPTSSVPVAVGAALSSTHAQPGQEVTVVIRAKLASGWRVYTTVPSGEPYIQTTPDIDLPDGVTLVNDWRSTPGRPDMKNPRLRVVADELVLTRRLHIDADIDPGTVSVTCRLEYQSCNSQYCMRPEMFETALALTIEPSAIALSSPRP